MVVQAAWPGATIEVTLKQLTERLERKLQETPHLDFLRSYTSDGTSTIFVNLKGSAPAREVPDIWYHVRKSIADIRHALPAGVVGAGFNDEFGDTFGIIYFTADGFSHRELRDHVEDIRSKLLRVPDVSKIEVLGAQDEKIFIEFSMQELATLGLCPHGPWADTEIPLGRAAGALRGSSFSYTVGHPRPPKVPPPAMPLDPHKLLNWHLPEIEHTYTEKDTILYALGLGCGADPQTPDDLRFVYEKDLLALPTMAVVLAYPGNWLASEGSTVDYSKVLHGEQSLTLHRPIPPAGTVVGSGRVLDLLDKGRDKGAVLYSERTVIDKATGAPIATMTSTTMLRGDGGWGGKSGPQPAPHRLPETAPDLRLDLGTYPNSALIYRLSGDWNPLHADPQAAAAGGFQRPILHGLCTFGVAGLALIKACCGGDPARLGHLQVRFSAPVYPGETIRTEMWLEGERVSFRARVVERDAVVLNNGLATVL